MGFLSNWWNGSSQSASAPAADAAPSTAQRSRSMEAKPNVWRSVFDPGSNPNVKNVGASYYDTVKDKNAPTTWDLILQGEASRRKSFSDLDADRDGFINKADLQQAVGAKVDINTLFAEADTNRDGKIDRREFSAVLEKYFQGRNT